VFAAVLDTCVLWPSLQRDFLLSLAVQGLYRPLWSSAILEELEFHEEHKLITRGSEPKDAANAAHRLVVTMGTAFDDAIVQGWEPLEGTYGLPDPDDEHVVAAAVMGNAGAIVTDNLRDFPTDLVPSHIQVISAKEFAADTVDVDPERALLAVEQMVQRRSNPPISLDETLDLLVARYSFHDAAELLEATRS